MLAVMAVVLSIKTEANVEKRGGYLYSSGITMIDSGVWRFMIVLSFYVSINLYCYYLLYGGIEHLNGITSTDSEWVKFGQTYFLVQTFTTVGYGHISPTGFDQFSAAEALIGLLSFAIATGYSLEDLVNHRFLKFSHECGD
jgi:inward rectifier potassium channel